MAIISISPSQSLTVHRGGGLLKSVATAFSTRRAPLACSAESNTRLVRGNSVKCSASEKTDVAFKDLNSMYTCADRHKEINGLEMRLRCIRVRVEQQERGGAEKSKHKWVNK